MALSIELPALALAMRDELHRLCAFAWANPDLSAYLLMDPLLDQPIADDMLADMQPPVTQEVLPCPGLWPDKQTCPVLYAVLPDRHGPLIEHAFRYALHEQLPENRSHNKGFAVCGLLFSELDAKRTAAWLASKTRLQGARGQHHFFSYFDRRVLLQLPSVLGDEGMNALMGPVARWYTIDRQEQWQSVVNARHAGGEPFTDGARAPEYSSSVWQSLECIAAVNQALDLLVEAQGQCTTLMERVVSDAVQRACRDGLTDTNERAMFAVDAFYHHSSAVQPGSSARHTA